MAGKLTSLLQRVRRGDPSALAALVAEFHDSAQRLADALLHDGHLAEEAVQESFVAALAQLSQLREAEAFPGWFRKIVRTQACRLLRKPGAKPGELPDACSREPSPLEAAQLGELRERVNAAFSGLPAMSRRSAELFCLQERSIADIAAILDIPAGTVKRRLHDARARLRKILGNMLELPERSNDYRR